MDTFAIDQPAFSHPLVDYLIALRSIVGTRTLDELLENKSLIDEGVRVQVAAQKDLVEVVYTLKQVVCVKG